MTRNLRPLALAALPLLGACDLLDDVLSEFDGDLETRNFSVDSSDGKALIDVELDGQESFQLTATSGQLVAVEAIYDADGDRVLYWEDWYGTESLTGAVWLEGQDTVLNWPVRAVDPELTAGTWQVEVGVVDSEGYYTDAPVDAVLKLKQDPDLSDGTVSVRIVYTDGLMQDAVVSAGVQAAVTRWEEVWSPYGLQLEPEYESSAYSNDQAFPGESGEHDDLAQDASGSEVTVLIAETIDGDVGYYGIAGSIPGTLDHTGRALVVVSWLANAGGDGTFSDDDIRLFGETLAHEVGHYMGLFHPVEMTWDYWDALSDTDACQGQGDCESGLGDNLMFPYPVCDWTDCTAQDQLTSGQTGVSHRYTGTL